MANIFIDVETTGLDHNKHGIVQLAAIPIIDGEKKESFCSYSKPFDKCLYDDGALKVNGLTRSQILTFDNEAEVLDKFIKYLYSLQAKFKFTAYNAQFDKNFVYALFCRNQRYGDYKELFRDGICCVLDMAKTFIKDSKNHKLKTICDYYKIDLINAHDALADIEATIKVYDILKTKKEQLNPYEKEVTYLDKRKKYLQTSHIQIGKDNDVYISSIAVKNKEALLFIIQELWDLYGDD